VVSLGKLIKNKLHQFENLMMNELSELKFQNDRLKGTLGAMQYESSIMTENMIGLNKAINEISAECDAALKKCRKINLFSMLNI
jgi:hypothetical protein